MSFIDNKKKTMRSELARSLVGADNLDVLTAYFYFSGFETLAEEIQDKHVRILVGMEIDPKLVPQMASQVKSEGDIDLSRWQPRVALPSGMALEENYREALIGLINDSDLFDSWPNERALELFVKKIEDNSLEVRQTQLEDHSKLYLVHKGREDAKLSGAYIVGSSNMTYRGLVQPGELNYSGNDEAEFTRLAQDFDDQWSRAVTVIDRYKKLEFVGELKSRVWKYSLPTPHEMYIRVLHELFDRTKSERDITTPHQIDRHFLDLDYQLDAIRDGISRLIRHDGVIIADVVGLGKSIVASCIARNVGERGDFSTAIIAPPHLVPQWQDYAEQFRIPGARVFSSGKIGDVLDHYHNPSRPLLIVLDEAHRYRNEETNDYKMLHRLCRSHEDNKTLLLTATPFSNAPQDIFALIKLFQVPGRSTIRSSDNLSQGFRQLTESHNKLLSDARRGKDIDDESEASLASIGQRSKQLVEHFVIRRSRLDLKHIKKYALDLKKRRIEFSEVGEPEMMEYDLGPLFQPYTETLDLIRGDEGNKGLTGARYKPATYIKNLDKFLKRLRGLSLRLPPTKDLVEASQKNSAYFMRRLLARRFESSKSAFRSTLQRVIDSNKEVQRCWEKNEPIPLMKAGRVLDLRNFADSDYDPDDGYDDNSPFEVSDGSGLVSIPKANLRPSFIDDVRHDLKLLEFIEQRWFGDPALVDVDPKTDDLARRLRDLLTELPTRKILIFSSYAETVDYLYEALRARGFSRLLRYSAKLRTRKAMQEINANFDASLPDRKQVDDYDILIATDAVSEGYNLHRAGVIINYDIPYNPIRVIQRIGRINRINKKVFDKLQILNSFPTATGEGETRIKEISTMKMKLFNDIIGNDTKILTADEQPQSVLRNIMVDARSKDEKESWDAVHRNAYNEALSDTGLMDRVRAIPRRSRVARKGCGQSAIVVFGKKGDQEVFATIRSQDGPEIITPEEAINNYFIAKPGDKPYEVRGDEFALVFSKARDALFARSPVPNLGRRRQMAIKTLTAMKDKLPGGENYYSDLIMIIGEYDDVNEGALLDINRLDLRNIDVAHSDLQKIIPRQSIRSAIARAQRAEAGEELILLSEKLET